MGRVLYTLIMFSELELCRQREDMQPSVNMEGVGEETTITTTGRQETTRRTLF